MTLFDQVRGCDVMYSALESGDEDMVSKLSEVGERMVEARYGSVRAVEAACKR